MEKVKDKTGTVRKKIVYSKTKQKRLCYSRESVKLALEEVRQGRKIAEVSKKYNIPESTIRAKRDGLYADKKPGPATVLRENEENDLVDWMIQCREEGFLVGKSNLLNSVRLICIQTKRKTPFVDNMPGRGWYDGFLARHPQISMKVSENVSLNQTQVSESSKRNWFGKNLLESRDLSSIESCRVFSCEEIGIPLNPKSDSDLIKRGCKDLSKMDMNSDEENINVLITGNAAGELAPSFIVFKGKSLPDKCLDVIPEKFAFSFSVNGWMTAANFYEYMENVFEPWLTKKGIQRPIIFFMHGHSSYMTLPLSKFCLYHKIILVALHSNATDIIQPINEVFFDSLKSNWLEVFNEFCTFTELLSIRNHPFPLLFLRSINNMDIKKFLPNEFKKCGLYPLNPHSIHFKEVLRRNNTLPDLDMTYFAMKEEKQEANGYDLLRGLESMLTKDQLEAFQLNTQPTWQGVERDESLFNIWYILSHPTGSIQEIVADQKVQVLMVEQHTQKIKEEPDYTTDPYISSDPLDDCSNGIMNTN